MPWESFEELAASYGLRQLRHPGCQTWAGSRFPDTPLCNPDILLCFKSVAICSVPDTF